eukprot:768378-Hanusia_phi.AAC.2
MPEGWDLQQLQERATATQRKVVKSFQDQQRNFGVTQLNFTWRKIRSCDITCAPLSNLEIVGQQRGHVDGREGRGNGTSTMAGKEGATGPLPMAGKEGGDGTHFDHGPVTTGIRVTHKRGM